MSQNDAIDLRAVKTFYDPHPGFAGAAIPIPSPVKLVADQLDGQSLTLGEAVKRLQAVTSGVIKVDPEFNCIFLKLGGGGKYLCHMFRVIRYR